MPHTLNVTWIAPTVPGLDELAWLNELGRLQSIEGVTVRTLTGDAVTLDKVAALLRVTCDVLIWAGHGTAGGLLLPNRVIVKPLWFAAQAANGCSPRVVILAACGSQLRDTTNLKSLTETLCRRGINAVGFPTRASDLAAGTFSVEYIRALIMGVSVVDAFDVALEQITGDETAAGVFFTPGVHDLPFMLETSLTCIEQIATHNERLLMALVDSLRQRGAITEEQLRIADETPASQGESSIKSLSNKPSKGRIRGLTLNA